MDKWNEQAAPNNNNKASDMEWSLDGSPKTKTAQDTVSQEKLNNRKIEKEIREQNY